MKPKAKRANPERPSKPAGTTGNPCFNCGLIFAKKEEYVQHMERYHHPKPQDGQKDHFQCHECEQTFPIDDESGFKEHLLIHDLSKIYCALKRYDMSRKKVHPLIVSAPPPSADGPTTSSFRTDTPNWTQDEKILPAPGEQAPVTKNKGGRPRSKSVFNIAKRSEVVAKATTLASATPGEAPRKRRRVSNETPTPAAVTPTQSNSGSSSALLPPPPSAPSTPQAPEPAPASTDQKGTQPAAFLPPPLPTVMPILAPQAPLNVPKVMPALNSACPNCNQNLGKPWHLVDHMIQMHDAQLLRLHRTMKRPDGIGGMVVMAQMFTDRQCPFCQLTYADMQTSLLHVVRTHRSRLFECPDNGECVLTCELMCAIGPDAAPKKFTISVKVKRKTNE